MESRRLVRSDIDRVVGGVCGGIANYIGADPFVVRVIFVILVWAFGLGWWLYAALWAIIPGEGSGRTSE